MPKMKTNSGAKKRFKVTPSGKVRMAHAYKNHILTKKTTKQKRRLTHMGMVHECDMPGVKLMLCIGK